MTGRSVRSNIQGSIHLKLWLSSRENRGLNEEEDMWNEIWQHQHIYTLFLIHHLNSLKVTMQNEDFAFVFGNEFLKSEMETSAIYLIHTTFIDGTE